MTTETANAVPATTDNAAAANVTPAANGSEAGKTDAWWSGLQDEGNRKIAETKGWKDPDTAIKSYSELEKRLTEVSSKALTLPAENATQEERDAFYTKLGRPEKADGYDFKLPADISPDLPYDGELASQAKQWAHKAGLSPQQAQLQHDEFVKFQAANYTKAIEAQVQRETQATGELVKVWGDKSSDGFKQNIEFADRFIRNGGGDALLGELKANGLLSSDGAILSPILAQAMSKAGKALYTEDKLVTGAPASGQKPDAAKTLYPNDPFKR